jgi:thiol:disulfide interchange protein DsbA
MVRYCLFLLILPLLFACEDDAVAFIEVNGKTYMEGSDYQALETPIRFDDSPLANFIEVFWYGCPHCERFEPIFQEWSKDLPAGIRVARSPAMWNEVMVVHAHAYFMSLKLELGHEFHMQLFSRILSLRISQDLAFHKQRISSLFEDKGFSREEFDRLYDSPEIVAQVNGSKMIMNKAGISSTPSFLINGKYLLSGAPFKSNQELLAVARHLLLLELDRQPIDWW